IFTEEDKFAVGDEGTPEKNVEKAVEALNGILDKAGAIGGVKSITLEADGGRLNFSRVNDFYLVMVASKNADANYINTVVRVLVPTVISLLKKIYPTPLKSPTLPAETAPKTQIATETETPRVEIPTEAVEEKPKEVVKPEPLLPEPPVNQLIVENLGGLMLSSETVRIDSQILSKWEKLYEGKRIEDVAIETFNGKTVRCKVKPIKDQKYEGKGLIQIPDKIQQTLEIKKGELVKAKPIVM
ncbi:MAG: hypothetical protein QW222_06775, partial [Candidatus Bathyarchaeia archaeon]